MTAEITNLRTVRKRQLREQKEHTAAENRIRFGRTKFEKARIAVETARVAKHLDGHKRDTADRGGDIPPDDKKR